MRRVRLTAEHPGEFKPLVAQELVFQIPGTGPEPMRRHYTIRRYDPENRIIEVDFVMHAHTGPGAAWARAVRPGDTIHVRGPRGRIRYAADADWHLYSGDESALPAICALIEAMPAGSVAIALLEVGSEADVMALQSAARLDVQWLLRAGAPPGPGPLLLDALNARQLPSGRGHAYVIGETSNVRAQRHALLARGFGKSQIWSEGYWRPGRIGGHDHIDD
ncbi:MAG: siderophore-interacting protein [Gammaproteobacteria bacterium]|nr:siderophore-interacting protein [Gammaproteobacteria bacterium]MDE2250165.1 siderophore-interacting protein [Gammaproteobacteria bacterium]